MDEAHGRAALSLMKQLVVGWLADWCGCVTCVRCKALVTEMKLVIAMSGNHEKAVA